jgi:RNA polymerase sigma-70 factor (ECF subfamily)
VAGEIGLLSVHFPLESKACMSSAADESQLLMRIGRGDELALAALYDRFARPIYSMVYRITHNERDAEEIVQDVFLTVWRTASTFDPKRASAFTWLTTVARNKAIDRIRAAQRRIPPPPSEEVASVRESVDLSANPADEVSQADQSEALGSIVRTLPTNQRQAIELAFFEGLTHPEIAERLGETIGTVKSRIRLGMEKLRQKLKGGRNE